MARGFYSVIQYCPDRFRAESVNVGVVLLGIDPHKVLVRTTNKFDRVRRVFGITGSHSDHLRISLRGFTSRIETSAESLKTREDLAIFAASRANDLQLTEPRLTKSTDFNADLNRLFSQLVDEQGSHVLKAKPRSIILPTALDLVINKLKQEQRIWDPPPIKVPILNSSLDAPYAYRNGVINLLKPYSFAHDNRAENQAVKLAIEGDLINKHKINGESHRLVVISTHENDSKPKDFTNRIANLFKEYNVRLIQPDDAEDFAREIETEAH